MGSLCHAVALGKKIITSRPLPALLLAPFFCAVFDSRSSFFAPKPQGNACYADYHGPREQGRPVPRVGVIKKGSVMDRESSVALCHGVALKKKMIGRRPRERCVSFPLFGRKNELQGRKEHNAKGDRERAESRSLCCFT